MSSRIASIMCILSFFVVSCPDIRDNFHSIRLDSMQDGGKNAWGGTCHKDNKHREGEIHNIVSLIEDIEAMLYDILLRSNTSFLPPMICCSHLNEPITFDQCRRFHLSEHTFKDYLLISFAFLIICIYPYFLTVNFSLYYKSTILTNQNTGYCIEL